MSDQKEGGLNAYQAFSALRERASALAEVLKQYYALWEQTPANSAVYPVLQKWQARLTTPRYEDTLRLREDLVRPYQWQISVEGWEKSLGSIKWEFENTKLKQKESSIIFSPDGHYLLARDFNLYLWRIKDQQCVATLQAPYEFVIKPSISAAFSPDGLMIASGEKDMVGGESEIRLWRVKDRKSVAIFQRHSTHCVNNVVFSPDGNLLASSSYDKDKSVQLWRVKDQKCVATLKGEHVSSVTFSPDGRLLAGRDGQIVRLWRVEDQQCVAALKGHSWLINVVTFSPDGQFLASGSGDCRAAFDNSVRLWRVKDWQCVATLKHASMVWAIAFSPDGQLLASGSRSTVQLWRIEDLKCLATLQGHIGWVDIAFSPDGRLLASGADDAIFLWSPRQTATVEMSLGELIAWEKKYAGQYSEIKLVE